LKTTSLQIPAQNYHKRRERLCQYLQDQQLSGAVLFEREYILYYTGFAFIPTERPLAFVLNDRAETALLVPRLELEHARSNAHIGRVDHYIEYPDDPRPETVLQTLAIETLQPGIPCAQVDRAVRAYYQEHELFPYWKHHSGHAIGLRYHEAPYLDHGDPTLIRPGMVFTVEPGLYSPDLGGFRHSDTVLVTEQGAEMLTYYPRDLESLTIPV